MHNVQTMVLVYRVLIGGGGHLDWQLLRAPQYVNPALEARLSMCLCLSCVSVVQKLNHMNRAAIWHTDSQSQGLR